MNEDATNGEINDEDEKPLMNGNNQALQKFRTSSVTRVANESDSNNAALIYLARLAPGSRRTMRGALDVIAEVLTGRLKHAFVFPWQQLRYEHTQAIRATLAEKYSPATANKMLAALRGVMRECWRLGLIDAEEFHRAIDVASVRGTTLPRGRALSAGELRTLFAECVADDSPAGVRDAALFAVLYGAGLRRAEAVAIDVGDYDIETGALKIKSGKGRKARIAYATGGAKAAIEAWLCSRALTPPQPKTLGISMTGALFCPINKGGRLVARRMSDQAVLNIVIKRALRSGVKMFSPHDLRRSFISDLLDAGADISTVQGLAGHANVQTTARYDRRGEKARRRAAEMLHVPYNRS